MPKKDFGAFFFLDNKNYRITIPLTTLICLVLLLIEEHLGGNGVPDFSLQGWIIHKARVYAQIVPVMILTSLSGYGVGSLVVLLFFSIEAIVSHIFPYHAFVLLMASLIANLPIFKHWYKSVPKTILSALIFSLFLGNGWNILLAILEERQISFEAEALHFFVAFLPSAMVTAFCYFYYNYFPERIKNLFFASVYDSEEVNKLKTALANQKGRRIRDKLANLIIAEAVILMITGFALATSLLDQFRNTVIRNEFDYSVFICRYSTDVRQMFIYGHPIIYAN